MIEFYPDNLIGNDFDSPGEFELYKKFKELSARRNWVVFHSQGVHKHVSQFMGEIDYVIIMPKVGVLTVEVKACKTLLFDPKLAKPWKIGSKDYEKRGPFKQAEDNSRSLKEFFHEEYPVLKKVLFWHTVVFTEIDFKTEQNIAWNRWEYINSSELDKAKDNEYLELFENVIYSTLKNTPAGNYFTEKTPTYNQVTLLKNLRKKIEIYQEPKKRIEKNNIELNKVFNENQANILRQLNRNKKCIIEGPAGTGKTMLAIEMAKRNALQGKKTLFICFNTYFGNYLKKIEKEINESVGCEGQEKIIYFYTANSLYAKIVNEIDTPIKFLKTKVFEKLLNNEVASFLERSCDNLIIDEFQDLLKREDIEILDLFFEKGLKNISYYLFGDFYYQDVQNFDKEKMSIDNFTEDYPSTIFELNENCRNFPDVLDFSANLCGFNPYVKYLRSDKNTRPKIQNYKDDFDQLVKIDNIIDNLVKENFQFSEIVLLSMKKYEDSCFKYINYISKDYSEWSFGINQKEIEIFQDQKYNSDKKLYGDYFLKLKSYNKDYDFKKLKNLKSMNIQKGNLEKESYIYWTTIRRFKGLENNIVIITDLDNLDTQDQKFLLHTGLTRSTDKVIVLMNEKLKINLGQI